MNSLFRLLTLYVVFFTCSASQIPAFQHTGIHDEARTSRGHGTSLHDMVVVERSGQSAWQATSIALLKKRLLGLGHELSKARESRSCLSKKIRLVRILRRKLKYSHCGMKNIQRAKRVCERKSQLTKQVKIAQRECAWKRMCIAKKMRAIMRKIKFARVACLCVQKGAWKKHLNELKTVKCPKTRSKFAIRAEMRKLRARINYLKKLMHPHPSALPRVNPKSRRGKRYRNVSHRRRYRNRARYVGTGSVRTAFDFTESH